MKFYQCALHQGDTRTVGWIEARGAKSGARVELKGQSGLWDVVSVFQPPIDATWLDDKRRRDRGSLKSLAPA